MKTNQVRVRRLGWAGVEIEYGNKTLLIDYIQDKTPLGQLRDPDIVFPPASRPGQTIGALLTHLHADHADPQALQQALRPGAPVFRPEPAGGTPADKALTEYAEAQLLVYPLATEIVGPGAQRQIGPFTVHSFPAVDGFGDPQLSWLVECNGQRIFHAGDTLFHGYWWRVTHQFGPPQLAFLPVNGAIVDFPLLQPASPLEAVMTPEQAVTGASLLGGPLVVPIHYGVLHKPPMYTETPGVIERLFAKAAELGLTVRLQEPGEWFVVG